MRRLALVAGLLLPAATASAQTTTPGAGISGAGAFGDQPSTFREIALPRSSFAEKRQESEVAARSQGSTFGLADMDEKTRLKTESMLSDLGARKRGGAILIDLPSDVLFDFDRAEIRADARPVLLKMSEILKALQAAPVEIIGHTDSMGTDEYNQRLSERRAASVMRWLAANGVTSSMTILGKGETAPAAANTKPDGTDDPAGRQKNRRVEFIVGGK